MAGEINAIGAVSEAIRELTALLREWIAGSDVRRLKAAVQAGETYIRLADELVEEYVPKEEKKRRQQLESQKERFFKFN